MSDVALISELTWRSLAAQKAAYPGMRHFVAPDEIATMLRPTRRKDTINIHVVSLAVVADNERDFLDFLKLLMVNKAVLHSQDENATIYGQAKGNREHFKYAVNVWRAARKNGAAKAGGRISADRRKAASKEAVEKIRHLWCLPSSQHSIAEIEKICGKARGTIVSILGNRGIAQYNYQAKLKRKANVKPKN